MDIDRLEFGIDTFGDVTAGPDGALLPHDQVIRNLIDEAVLADEVGLDVIGIGEHHRDDFAVSAPDMVLAAASGRGGSAERLRGDEVLVVGDQLLKDVAAARAADARVLLVPRLGPSDHLGVRVLQRPLEAVLRRRRGLPVRSGDWPAGLARVAS